MLKSLSVSNYAIIYRVAINFGSGLGIITGETGSGKSLVIGALGLLLGKRAEGTALREPDKKCIIEAQFDIASYELEGFFATHELDFDKLAIIRRELWPGGRSRAFINDTPVQLKVLKDLSEHLVDVHSQHENALLNTRAYQFRILDKFGGHEAVVAKYLREYEVYQGISTEIITLQEARSTAMRDRDFFVFQHRELEEAELDKMDKPTLEEQVQTLANTEEIATSLSAAHGHLDGENKSALDQLKQAKQALGQISAYSKSAAELAERVQSIIIEAEDIAAEIYDEQEHITANPELLAQVNAQLNQLYRLEEKHHLEGVKALIDVRNGLADKIFSIDHFDDKIAKLQAKLESHKVKLMALAEKLTTARKKAAKILIKSVEQKLSGLNMPDAQLHINIDPAAEFDSFGKDDLAWLVSTNKGSEPGYLHKIASGGEQSRIMLALKATLATKTALPTIILDEIDTGVSGEVADKMGRMMAEMGQNLQVISITHLPQIAGKGSWHLKVAKDSSGAKTQTVIHELDNLERIHEIAGMLSGDEMTAAAVENAKEMLKSA